MAWAKRPMIAHNSCETGFTSIAARRFLRAPRLGWRPLRTLLRPSFTLVISCLTDVGFLKLVAHLVLGRLPQIESNGQTRNLREGNVMATYLHRSVCTDHLHTPSSDAWSLR